MVMKLDTNLWKLQTKKSLARRQKNSGLEILNKQGKDNYDCGGRLGWSTEQNTQAQDKGRRRLENTWGQWETGGHNQESGKTIRLVTHEEGPSDLKREES